MARISIVDLQVFYRVGVSDEERAKPQRLLLTVDMEFDITSAAISGRVGRTIDYQIVSQHLLRFGERQAWRLVEMVATDVADKIIREFHPDSVTVEVKKFAIAEGAYASVCVTKERYVPPKVRRAWWWQDW